MPGRSSCSPNAEGEAGVEGEVRMVPGKLVQIVQLLGVNAVLEGSLRQESFSTWPSWVKGKTSSSQRGKNGFKVAFSFLDQSLMDWGYFLMEIVSCQSVYSQASFLLLPPPLCSLLFPLLSPGLLPPAFPWECFSCLLLSLFSLCWFTRPNLSALKSIWAQAPCRASPLLARSPVTSILLQLGTVASESPVGV